MEEWLASKGESILREIGFKEGQIILDFGCGSGIYAILISKIIGDNGKIYAIDSDNDSIDELNAKITYQKLRNIKTIKTSGEISIPLENNSLDIVLLYDVYHLLNNEERNKIIKETKRVLKKGGLMSYLATHIGSYDINLNKVHVRMKKYKFELIEKFRKLMIHWGSVEECEIFNYYKI